MRVNHFETATSESKLNESLARGRIVGIIQKWSVPYPIETAILD